MSFQRSCLMMFPWDFVDEGVDDLVARVRDLGITRILVASQYHAGFFLHPHNPRRKTHLLEDGVAYFHPTPACYEKSPMKPQLASICADHDWLGDICKRAVDVGLSVSAWHVCLHNTRLGLAHPRATIQNAYGDSYPHALSPAHPEARRFVMATIRDVVEQFPLASVLLEAPDYRRRAHGGTWVAGHHHERDGVYLRPLEQALMDVSFNEADVHIAQQSGVDVDAVRRAIRTHINRYFGEAPQIPNDLPDSIDDFRAQTPSLVEYEVHFRRMEELLLAEARDIVHAGNQKLEAKSSPACDWIHTGGYGETPQRVHELALEARATLLPHQQLNFGVRMGFNLPHAGYAMLSEQDTCEMTRAVHDGGADEIVFYNYGESPRRSVEWIQEALKRVV